MTPKRKSLKLFIPVFVIVLFLPEFPSIPVKGATANDWNAKSFWFETWGNFY